MNFVPLDPIAEAKGKRKQSQAFYTPLGVVDDMVRWADVCPSDLILEPSFGDGRIVHAIKRSEPMATVHGFELDRSLHQRAEGFGCVVLGDDFLAAAPDPHYDAVLMNPPFAVGQAAKHIARAYRWLRPGGKLISVAPANFRSDLEQLALDLPGCEYATYETIEQRAWAGLVSIETILVEIVAPLAPEHRRRHCEWFETAASANAAYSIENDRELLESSRGKSPEQLRKLASRFISSSGGSVYGVDWQQVHTYLNAE